MRISNRLVVGLLALAIMISLAGTLISLSKIGELKLGITGMATNTTQGITNLTITSRTELVNRNLTLDWGTGYINGSYASCNLSTVYTALQSHSCANFSVIGEGFLLENAGNFNLSINYTSGKTAATFIGGENPSPEFQINVTPAKMRYLAPSGDSVADTINACNGATNISTWRDVAAAGDWICGNLTTYSLDPSNDRDAIAVDLRIVIPLTATAGAKSNNLTFNAWSSG